MKSLLTTIIGILLFTFTCKAQNTFPATGNVGIGTTTPTAGKLVIDANTAAPSIALHISNTAGGAGNNGAVTFGGSGSSAGAYGFIDYNPSSNFGIRYSALGPLVFGSNTNAGYSASTFTETMRMTATGNLGIGTTAPVNKLHIVDVTGTNTLNLQLSTNTLNETIGVAFGTQPGNRTKAAIAGVNTNAGNSAGALAFYTNAGASLNETMRINSVGNVGIGSSTPASQLHVYENSIGNNSATGITLEQAGTGNALLQFLQTGVQRWTMGIDNSTAGSQSFKIATGIGLGVADKFTILKSGYVGIGTANPDQKLTVNGTVHATQVIVDTNIPTPDYVFDKTYDLPTLTDVKIYIDKNHHLPEMPSAAEVAKNGQNLGEMNMLLLKKVEELTLYLIEKDKQDEKKTAQLTEQQVQIDQLKQQVIELKKSYKN